ncbi:hypothetical protein [Roseomonas elaeocarpi]|uniref:Uncharacterized protein n=1 Tax=Roseomonas elaeocarpi TaxID=907779 RepID=A0ABV6JT09_9PROT
MPGEPATREALLEAALERIAAPVHELFPGEAQPPSWFVVALQRQEIARAALATPSPTPQPAASAGRVTEPVMWRRRGKYRWFYRESAPSPQSGAGWLPLYDEYALAAQPPHQPVAAGEVEELRRRLEQSEEAREKLRTYLRRVEEGREHEVAALYRTIERLRSAATLARPAADTVGEAAEDLHRHWQDFCAGDFKSNDFLERMEAAGFVEYGAATEGEAEELNAGAWEGMEKGSPIWRLTEVGSKALAARTEAASAEGRHE